MNVPPPNPFYDELRMKERMEKRLTTEKLPQRASLITLIIILLVIGVIVFFAFHH